MQFIQHLNRLKRIHQLVKLKATGTPHDLARRLEISEPSVYRCLNDLKELGAPVKYCKERQYYIYEQEFDLKL
jgi:predicted DNA-binding transcriptional regulator YafY